MKSNRKSSSRRPRKRAASKAPRKKSGRRKTIMRHSKEG